MRLSALADFSFHIFKATKRIAGLRRLFAGRRGNFSWLTLGLIMRLFNFNSLHVKSGSYNLE